MKLILGLAIVFLVTVVASSEEEKERVHTLSTDFISEDAIKLEELVTEAHVNETTRRQAMEDFDLEICPLDMGKLRYRGMVKQCDRNWTSKECCKEFLRLTCPYGKLVNDERLTCMIDVWCNVKARMYVPTGGLHLCECFAGHPLGISCKLAA